MPKFQRATDMRRQVNRIDTREKIELASEQLFPGVGVLAHRVTFRPGDRAPAHRHDDSAHVVFSVAGSGMVTSDDGPHSISVGDVVVVERGELHEWSNPGDEDWVFIELLLPPPQRTAWIDPDYQPGWHVPDTASRSTVADA